MAIDLYAELSRLTRALDDAGIDHAQVGALALAFLGDEQGSKVRFEAQR